MKFKKLKFATVSDIHLGHSRNEALYIIENLRREFKDDAKFAELDILFIAGDVFDSQLTLSDNDIAHIHGWIAYLLRICAKNDVVLRVLGGTHSHDWGQSKLFEYINESAGIGCDLKYVPDLSIEHMERFGLDVLYVPDEWDDDPNKTLEQVHELMRLKGISQVDVAIMHGQFEYQLPPVVKAPKHNSEAYLSLVKYVICIGHVHIHSRFKGIVAQGSFDRLTHGEEHPKGYVRVTLYEKGEYEIEFVENVNARKFLTVECRGLTIEDTLQEIEHFVKDVPDGSFVRVSCSPDNPILSEMNLLVREWPMITWSKISREDAFQVAPEIISEEDASEYIPITITAENISRLVLDRIKNKLSPDLLEIAQAAIEELR